MKTSILHNIGIFLLSILLISHFCACSEEEHSFTAQKDITDTYIDKLEGLIKDMTTLEENSDFGDKTGQYPSYSRNILVDAVSSANRDILLIKYQNPAPSENEKERYVSEAQNAISRFNASVRTEDAETIPAELFVDGKSNESYIDFGRSKDYVNFGETGSQAFTIELWVKITEHGPNDNSIFLSTFFSNDGSNWRNGWMMYWRVADNGIYRATWGGILSDNTHWGLWEPNFKAPQDNVWQHFVLVYNDKGLDGNSNLRAKLYLNGQVAATQENANSREVYNSSDYDNYNKPMTGFCRWVNNEKMEEGFSGYMKKIRIWKEAKTDAYIQSSYSGQSIVTGKEENLVAAWDFTSKPTGASNEILDLTGKHTAKIIGTYQWIHTQN